MRDWARLILIGIVSVAICGVLVCATFFIQRLKPPLSAASQDFGKVSRLNIGTWTTVALPSEPGTKYKGLGSSHLD
jgi:hypothetical protein